MTLDKRVNINEAIKALEQGCSIVVGGWGPTRKPMSLIRAIAGSPIKDLTVASFADDTTEPDRSFQHAGHLRRPRKRG